MSKVLVLYYSSYGHIETMANGATTIAGSDGSRAPSKIELDGARFQGRHIAEISNKLFGTKESPAVKAAVETV